MALIGLHRTDSAHLSISGRVLLNESIPVIEAGITDYSAVRIVANSESMKGGMLSNNRDEDDDFKRATDESIPFMQQTKSSGAKTGAQVMPALAGETEPLSDPPETKTSEISHMVLSEA